MESNFLNNEKAIESLKKLKDLLFILPDTVKYTTNEHISSLLSHFINNIKVKCPENIFVINYTIKNPIQEYIKSLTQIPIELFFKSNIEDYIYFDYPSIKDVKENISQTGDFGIYLHVPIMENINYYDHFIYFKIYNDDAIEVINVSPEFKKTIFKTNTPNILTQNNDKYNANMLIISNRYNGISEHLLKNISKELKLDFSTLVYELENEEPIIEDLKINRSLFNVTPVENKIVFNSIQTQLKMTNEYIKYYEKIIIFIFQIIRDYLENDFMNYIDFLH